MVTPDAGRVRVAEQFGQHLGADIAIVHKRRAKDVANSVEARGVVGPVDGRPCVLVDDMIDTAGTIASAAELLSARGAADVMVAATHGVLAGPDRSACVAQM